MDHTRPSLRDINQKKVFVALYRESRVSLPFYPLHKTYIHWIDKTICPPLIMAPSILYIFEDTFELNNNGTITKTFVVFTQETLHDFLKCSLFIELNCLFKTLRCAYCEVTRLFLQKPHIFSSEELMHSPKPENFQM